MSNLEIITKEINTELQKQDIQNALLGTTFKGLSLANMKTAMFEGMSRGFSFKDFLEKNIYAIPFKNGYSLINSIDYSRKIGMRSGVVGVSEPTYETDGEKIISCSIIVKRRIDGYVGDFAAKVYFKEYYSGHKNEDGTVKKNQYGDVKANLWDTKPRTMIAKVAEMHALRKACPEELAQIYVEEEMQKETQVLEVVIDESWTKNIDAITDLKVLSDYYKANKGKGKEFDKLIINRKKILEEGIKKDDTNS